MDDFYDKVGAASKLEDEARERRCSGTDTYTATFQHLADLELEGSTVTEIGACRKNWKLCVPCEEDGVLDEVVFGVQGVLTNVNLVPITVGKMDPRRAIRLTQRVEIAGLGTPTFEEALRKLESAHDQFSEHFCGQDIGKIDPQNGEFGRALACSNRVFTMRADYPTEQSTEFEAGVDPLGSLEKLSTKDLFHGPGNVVKYFRRATDPKGGGRIFDSGFPGSFKVGDLVEIQGSITIPLRSSDEAGRQQEASNAYRVDKMQS
ncbi:hypothetical protein B0H16DRAFT_1717899 [Mycena metata]|uniref:Uncharacterized protein n=1 Tax=Mycena metata TaxID=1033252 RepID=A0AAD7NLN8_9AGAR|nr:hypothetical protein B0H16DRAFT_1717899 [Mycena metata]